MAIKKVIESDLSGRQDAERVTFGLGETWYEIDLTDDERQGLEAALKSYLAAGRKATQEPPKPRKMVPTTTPEEREKIREWGRENGFDFAPYGRIPKEVMAAYDAAHKITRSK
ncbi:nucleoid-associated protein Lsr2 [Arthrobacter sp. Hiyo1]|uniref:histone-like nucleoid-structuring protein Lsr2 n=1 Tax=Arthrobacter sp. Hiyo1 TaxID=1588020 RepID=UPI0006A3ABAF|nr:Lsr2 family protein [Arthrobacter sp. Hiyo1]GAP61324.1 nucleoid-associated protein Lsr2 [Arthrobacter sp. Hiyo1]